MFGTRVTTRYNEITRRGSVSGVCPVCGKKGKRTKAFSMTVNPFNKNPDGTVRTTADIITALDKQVESWLETATFIHAKCEGKQ